MSRQYLFAYGSLLTNTGDRVIDRLIKHGCKAVGEAYLQGRLFDLGHYPGAVPSPRASDQVKGQLFLLARPRQMLRVLDVYEGITADGAGEYTRQCVEITLAADGRRHNAWVYFYRGRIAGKRPIPSGDYLAYRAALR